MIRGPGIDTGKVRDDLVEHIDLAATSLALAGIAIPTWMQGRNLLAADYKPREAVFAARDRCDETVDHIRSVRTARYKYIRNYLNQRPHLQPNAYKDGKQIVQRLRKLHAAGKLNELQERLLFSPTRPAEELYDLAGRSARTGQSGRTIPASGANSRSCATQLPPGSRKPATSVASPSRQPCTTATWPSTSVAAAAAILPARPSGTSS